MTYEEFLRNTSVKSLRRNNKDFAWLLDTMKGRKRTDNYVAFSYKSFETLGLKYVCARKHPSYVEFYGLRMHNTGKVDVLSLPCFHKVFRDDILPLWSGRYPTEMEFNTTKMLVPEFNAYLEDLKEEIELLLRSVRFHREFIHGLPSEAWLNGGKEYRDKLKEEWGVETLPTMR